MRTRVRKHCLAEPDLSYLLGARGTVRAIGHEDGPEPPSDGIARYRSPEGSYRYVYYVDGAAISALQVMTRDKRTARVANVWTARQARRRGYASALLQQARRDFRKVEHSDDLSSDAAAWVERVGEATAPPDLGRELKCSTGGEEIHRGQWDGYVVAYDDRDARREYPLGRLDWQSWRDGDVERFRVKYIEVRPDLRRRNIATRLYKKLFDSEGITAKDLVNASLTPDGAAFRSGARLGERWSVGHSVRVEPGAHTLSDEAILQAIWDLGDADYAAGFARADTLALAQHFGVEPTAMLRRMQRLAHDGRVSRVRDTLSRTGRRRVGWQQWET